MVRGDQYSDESDSDWDSVSQAVPPITQPITQQETGNIKYNFFNSFKIIDRT